MVADDGVGDFLSVTSWIRFRIVKWLALFLLILVCPFLSMDVVIVLIICYNNPLEVVSGSRTCRGFQFTNEKYIFFKE